MLFFKNFEQGICGSKCNICGKFTGNIHATQYCDTCVDRRPGDCERYRENLLQRVTALWGDDILDRNMRLRHIDTN